MYPFCDFLNIWYVIRPNREIKRLLQTLNKDGLGVLKFGEIVLLVAPHVKKRHPRKEIMRRYKVIFYHDVQIIWNLFLRFDSNILQLIELYNCDARTSAECVSFS